ncbi:hypothetical protein Tco_1032094 [Tanacetum coccineum]|uniref:Uncharacterized protein n=1 Tax=Tanacetum coccineum TaxID=301880 RepID=A0ABQ5GAW3_9ASTR
MGTKVTSSSGSVLEEPEIHKRQMQQKIFKKLLEHIEMPLKSTTQLLEKTDFLRNTSRDGFQIRSKCDQSTV